MARRPQALRAAATSVRRAHPVQVRHSVQRSEAVRYAAVVAYPRPQAVAAQFESGERLQAAVLRRWAVAVPVPARFFAEAVQAYFFAEAAALVPCSAQPKAQRSAAPEVLAGQAAARLPEESAARDVSAVPPRVAGHAGVAPEAERHAAGELQAAAEAWVAAAVLRPEVAAARGAAGALQPEAAARAGVEEEVLRPAAPDAAEGLRRAAPGALAAARPSAVPLVCRRDPALPWPAPSPAARFAHAMRGLRIASPKELSWQVTRDEDLS
jgi:hypothetical protein